MLDADLILARSLADQDFAAAYGDDVVVGELLRSRFAVIRLMCGQNLLLRRRDYYYAIFRERVGCVELPAGLNDDRIPAGMRHRKNCRSCKPGNHQNNE